MKRLGPICFGNLTSLPESPKVLQVREQLEALQPSFKTGIIEKARVTKS